MAPAKVLLIEPLAAERQAVVGVHDALAFNVTWIARLVAKLMIPIPLAAVVGVVDALEGVRVGRGRR